MSSAGKAWYEFIQSPLGISVLILMIIALVTQIILNIIESKKRKNKHEK